LPALENARTDALNRWATIPPSRGAWRNCWVDAGTTGAAGPPADDNLETRRSNGTHVADIATSTEMLRADGPRCRERHLRLT